MVSFKTALASYGLIIASQLGSCSVIPTAWSTSSHDDSLSYGDLAKRADPGDFYLRIMPLGASITAGTVVDEKLDPNKNGYRKPLRDKLRHEKWEVNMVGNRHAGTMNDNDHEGVPGDRVTQVEARAKQSCNAWQPSVVLINAGTNDATQNGKVESVDGTGARMRRLIDTVFSEVPNSVVVLSTLLPHKLWQDNVDKINGMYRDLYREYNPLDKNGNEPENPQFKVILAEMGDNALFTVDDLWDDTHPTPEGYKKMAAIWYEAIMRANKKGWLSAPPDTSKFSDDTQGTNCRKEFSSGQDDPRAGTQILKASDPVIRDDGPYVHSSKLRTDIEIAKFRGVEKEMRLYLAQLFNFGNPPGEELDEVIYVTEDDSDDRKIFITRGIGDGAMDPGTHEIDVKDTCNTRGIHWGDVNGDGVDDFICIARDGEMFVSINNNDGSFPPTFKSIGSYMTPKRGLGQEHVRLGDIDGDGRLDYCVIEGNGDIYCWRNGGLGDHASYWQDMGKGKPIFTGKGMGDIAGVRFVDINGDGRADWLWMDTKGRVTTYINQRGVSKTMIPFWYKAGNADGVTHPGMGEDVGDDRRFVEFGRLFGSGRADYIYWWTKDCGRFDTGDTGIYCYGDWKVFENTGKGGKYQKGDGIFWGDMTGSGVDDYIFIGPDGDVNVFRNKYTADTVPADNYNGPWSPPDKLNTGFSRRALHIGDWDGDKKADIIGVDRESGSVTVWHSRWDGSSFNWDKKDIADSNKCDQGWGRLYYDHGAHFADITGSGRVDYLCMEPDGRTTAWLRDNKGAWSNAKQVKFSEDWDRANFRFADADGDGLADMIWTDKFSGNGWVWYNLGKKTEADRGSLGGSLFEWEPRQEVYLGSSRGPNMYFPNLGGQSRADMVGANPIEGHAQVWFNTCPRGGDDVEGDVPDPDLPEYQPEPTDPGDPEDPEEHWFCSKKEQSWDTDLWKSHDLGRWLVQRSETYVARGQDWPGRDEDRYHGVPRVLGNFDGFIVDNAYNWPGACISISDEDGCKFGSSDIEDKWCTRQPERAFSLFSAAILNKFLQRWRRLFLDATNEIDKDAATMVKKFMAQAPSKVAVEDASWLTIAAGMFTSIGAFAPSSAAGKANLVAGIFTIGAGSAVDDFVDPPVDPRYDDFAALTSALSDITDVVTKAINRYYDTLFRNTPDKGNWEQSTLLARTLESGLYANQDFSLIGDNELVPDQMETMVRAAIIAEAWNSGHVVMYKFGKDSAIAKWGFDPCRRSDDDENNLGIGNRVGCYKDINYLITINPTNDDSDGEFALAMDYTLVGQNEETLKYYDLDQSMLIRAAERVQGLTKTFKPRNLDNMQSFFGDLAANPSGRTKGDYLFFNVPICDLDAIGGVEMEDDFCKKFDTSLEGTASCVVLLAAKHCAAKMTINGEKWPYYFTSNQDRQGLS